MGRATWMVVVVVCALCDLVSADAAFNRELNRLEGLRKEAIAEPSPRKAGEISDQIGALYLDRGQSKVSAGDNFAKGAGYHAEAARGSSLKSTQAAQYNAALASYAKARDAYAAEYAATKVALHQKRTAEAQAALDALKQEMASKGIEPVEPAPTPSAPVGDPAKAVPYTGAMTQHRVKVGTREFVFSMPTLFENPSGLFITNYFVGVSVRKLDKDPDPTCSTPVKQVNKETFTVDSLPVCFTSRIDVGMSPVSKSRAVTALYLYKVTVGKEFFMLQAGATLETKDPATPRVLGAVEAMARSLRLVGPGTASPTDPPAPVCKARDERGARSDTRTFEYADEMHQVFFKVAKDNDDGVAAAKGMAKFWKAGTTALDLILTADVLPPAAGKSGLGVGFVLDYLKKGGEILDRISTSPLTRRAMNVKAELFVSTTRATVTCESYEVCKDGAWTKAKRALPATTAPGGFRAVKRASKGDNEWGKIEVKRTPDLLDLDRLDAWAEAFLESNLAKLSGAKTTYETFVAECR